MGNILTIPQTADQRVLLLCGGVAVQFQKAYSQRRDCDFWIVDGVTGMQILAAVKTKTASCQADIICNIQQLMGHFGGIAGAHDPEIGSSSKGERAKQNRHEILLRIL